MKMRIGHERNRIETTVDLALLPDPQDFNEAMRQQDAHFWQIAINEEYDSLLSNNTWTVVALPAGRKALSTKWIFKKKIGPNRQVLKYKGRLVARGFQQVEGFDFTETYAGVVKASAWRTLFAMMVKAGWRCHQMDVSTAFLNGDVEEEIFVTPPQGFPEAKGMVLRLNKALYGLKQSPRQWYKKLRGWLEQTGWSASEYNECVFIHAKMLLIITVYVDDINIFGPSQGAITRFKDQIGRMFKMTDAGEVSWYLGMQIERTVDGLHIHQAAFTQQMLNRYGMQGVKPMKVPLDPCKKLERECNNTATQVFRTEYLSKNGSVNYLQTRTRWDLAFPVSYSSRFMANPNQGHLDAVHQVFSYINKDENRGLYFKNNGDNTIRGYVDSDWAGCKDTGRSTTGWVFTLAGSPISWCSQRQKTVATSSTEAEYVAASDACKEAIWLRGFYNELAPIMELQDQKAIQLGIDNASALKLTKNPEFHGRTKHINVRHHFIRECVKRGDIEPYWISGKENPADLFTKPLPRPALENIVDKLGGGMPVSTSSTTNDASFEGENVRGA